MIQSLSLLTTICLPPYCLTPHLAVPPDARSYLPPHTRVKLHLYSFSQSVLPSTRPVNADSASPRA
eukprot:3053531-Rhodomonas_salina.2